MTFPIPGVPPLPPRRPDDPDPGREVREIFEDRLGLNVGDAITRAAERIGDFVRAALADAARVAIVIVGTIALLAIGVVLIISGVFSLLGVDPKNAVKRGGPVGVAAQLVKG